MNSLTGSKKPWVTKLSSAGLIYLHFGKQVLQTIAGTLWPRRGRVGKIMSICMHRVVD